MIDSTVGIIVTARVDSKRLHQKVLQEINGQTTFEILLNHVLNDKYPTVVVTPKDDCNSPLVEICQRKGVEVFQTNVHNPLEEIVLCAENYGFDHIVRITADDILIDLTLLFMQIDFHIRGNRDYTYLKRCPEGTAGEVISVDALQRVYEELGNKRCEFISYYLKQDGFNYIEFYPPKEYQYSFRLTMDYEEDLILLRCLHSLLRNPGTLDIINLIKQNKYLLRINHLPKVSIITSVYNCSKYIVETMKSVLSQTFNDYEFIIIDDASTDNSVIEIVEYISSLNYDEQKRIRLYRNKENKKQGYCLNYGLELSRGKYIMCLDADDILYSDMLTELVEIIEQEQADIVMPGYDRIDEQGNKIETVDLNEKHLGCSLMSKWNLNILKFRDNIPFMVGADFLDTIKKDCTISYVKSQLWGYRKRAGQLTQSKEHPENMESK
jgi:spore coat polysaccharide biosynthesis protein SpsF (cytidylyltransferase family)